MCIFTNNYCFRFEATFGNYQLFSEMVVWMCTTKNTVISPNFLVWKFFGKIHFPHSFGRSFIFSTHLITKNFKNSFTSPKILIFFIGSTFPTIVIDLYRLISTKPNERKRGPHFVTLSRIKTAKH